ncbi:MAG: type II toxin-antitoxin system PemK/MazF family toxin [Bacteroidales bacterium]
MVKKQCLIKRFSVYWINLDPTQGSEINKKRPCVVISPDELNRYLNTVIVMPLTFTLRDYPWRVLCDINGKKGEIATDQIRCIDRSRVGDCLATLSNSERNNLLDVIAKMFTM